MVADCVAIGLSLLGVVLWTWAALRNVNRKLDRLLAIAESSKKGEDANHPDDV